MITAIRCNDERFKEVRLTSGMNVILADRTTVATQADSRNGRGKSSLIEIIHFCLGGNVEGVLKSAALQDHVFHLDMDISGKPITVSRGIATPKNIRVDGDLSDWPVQPRPARKGGDLAYTPDAWNQLLGQLLFGLPTDFPGKCKPTFRSLISYVVRRGAEAFINPFEHFNKQQESDKQVNTAFLLSLEWQNASQMKELKEKEKTLQTLRLAARQGLLSERTETRGELEAKKVELTDQERLLQVQLASFQVHLQYATIEKEANSLTAAIHEHSNHNLEDRQLVDLYAARVDEEEAPDEETVARVYAECGITLPDLVLKRLQDVQDFHHQVVRNRHEFIQNEIERLNGAISQRENDIKDLSDKRSKLLEILRTHGALEEYTRLQEWLGAIRDSISKVQNAISDLRKFEDMKARLRIDMEVLRQKMRRDHDERHALREHALSIFARYAQKLYGKPGRLVIDIGDGGFVFDAEIGRDKSAGVKNMLIFCYDLTLANLLAERYREGRPAPGFWVHDSKLFDGVDERQLASALLLAAQESVEQNYQYICSLNSDAVPTADLTRLAPEFDLQSCVRLTLTDDSASGGLFGFEF